MGGFLYVRDVRNRTTSRATGRIAVCNSRRKSWQGKFSNLLPNRWKLNQYPGLHLEETKGGQPAAYIALGRLPALVIA